MASQALKTTITSGQDPEIYTTTGWTEIWAQLDSAADGENLFGYDGSFTVVEAGATIRHTVAPNTTIKMKTSSNTPVSWAVIITELSFLEDIVEALCGGE